MSAKKNAALAEAAPATGGAAASLLRANARWMVIAAALVGGCAYGWKLLWEQVREHVVGSADYRLDPEAIEIPPLPAWIHTNLKAEVLRDASLDGALSVLDPELTVRVARAFGLHPWVAKIDRVSKHYPAGVRVELSYRKPVAMVEVAGPALLPVDAEGVLLPTEDFSPLDATRYPRVGEIKTSPLGPVGTRWGDTRVAGAARVAGLLIDQWDALKLYQIVPAGRQASTRGGVETDAYEIITKAGTRIAWGRPPGAEVPGEALAAKKVAWLVEYAGQHGGALDDPNAPHRIDVRAANGLIATPRPPVQPLPRDAAEQ